MKSKMTDFLSDPEQAKDRPIVWIFEVGELVTRPINDSHDKLVGKIIARDTKYGRQVFAIGFEDRYGWWYGELLQKLEM